MCTNIKSAGNKNKQVSFIGKLKWKWKNQVITNYYNYDIFIKISSLICYYKYWVLRVTNLNGLPHSLLSYGHLIPGERACMGRTCLIKRFFQGPSKGRYIPWAVPEDSGYWLNGVLRGWSANG